MSHIERAGFLKRLGRGRAVTRLFGPFMGATVQRKLDADMAKLRDALDSARGAA